MTKTELSKVKIPQNTGLSVSMWACEAGISLYVVISQLHSSVSIVALSLPPQLTATLPHQLPAWVLAFIPRSAESRLFVPPFSNNFCHSIKEKHGWNAHFCVFVYCFWLSPSPSVAPGACVMRVEIFWQKHRGGQKQKTKTKEKYRYARVVSR